MTTSIQQLPTIAAIASPIGQGGVGIIRLSGKDAYRIGCLMTRRSNLIPRMAHFGGFYGQEGVIDEGVIIYFKAPHSFTGEDVVELQGHGGMVLQNMLLARVFELGARQATAGEFSYRAFENDKIDLVQAEAISDAISATSVAQATSAIRSLTGEFSQKINELLDRLVHLRLYVEASIDFPEEEDVDFLSDGVIENKLTEILSGIDRILATAKQGQLLRDGVHVVLAGKPNAGKSSLLNRLSGTERAIVTEIAGTTRDTLEETLILNGLTIHLTGLRKTDDHVEKIGIKRAFDAIHQADVLMMVYDVTTETDPLALADQLFCEGVTEDVGDIIRQKLILVANKSDLLASKPVLQVSCETKSAPKLVYVSCETGEGLDELIEILTQKAGFHPPENSLIARTRHLDALNRAKGYAIEAYEQLTIYHAGELVAESLRQSQQALGEITGQMSADELLGKIFSSFCIGK